jgi:hypothetical protein
MCWHANLRENLFQVGHMHWRALGRHKIPGQMSGRTQVDTNIHKPFRLTLLKCDMYVTLCETYDTLRHYCDFFSDTIQWAANENRWGVPSCFYKN